MYKFNICIIGLGWRGQFNLQIYEHILRIEFLSTFLESAAVSMHHNPFDDESAAV